MKIYEIKLAGEIDKKTGLPVAYATIHRAITSDVITVTISQTDGHDRRHLVEADNPEDLFSMARRLQEHLNGCQGTGLIIHNFYRLLQNFANEHFFERKAHEEIRN